MGIFPSKIFPFISYLLPNHLLPEIFQEIFPEIFPACNSTTNYQSLWAGKISYPGQHRRTRSGCIRLCPSLPIITKTRQKGIESIIPLQTYKITNHVLPKSQEHFHLDAFINETSPKYSIQIAFQQLIL